jgi:CRISPR-associated protein Cas2
LGYGGRPAFAGSRYRLLPFYAKRKAGESDGVVGVPEDISDPKRLRRVATACEDFGVRKQLSVFLCRLSPTDRVRLRSRLWELIDHRADQVLFIPLCARCVQGIEALGRPTEAVDARDVVIVV